MCTKIEMSKDPLKVGSMNYIAPEVLEYRPGSPTSDVWSTCVVLYTLLKAELPFDGDTYHEVRN